MRKTLHNKKLFAQLYEFNNKSVIVHVIMRFFSLELDFCEKVKQKVAGSKYSSV